MKLTAPWPQMGLIALFVVHTAACAGSSPEAANAPDAVASEGGDTDATTPATPQAEPATEPAAHMEANFLRAERARDALVFGRVQEARDHARTLRDRDQSAAFPGSMRHYLQAMRQHADEVVLAGSLQEAGHAIGQLGVTCGNCHHFTKAGPAAEPVTALPWKDPPEPVMARMLRHDIGVLQMWQGLTAPSDAAWHKGSITLTRAPLEAPEQAGEAVGDRAHAAMERIRDLAKAARVAGTHGERGEVFGALIAECAACHMAPPR